MQNSGIAIDAVRLIDAIAIGAQLITLDTYASEIVPRNLRGRVFALSFAIIQTAVPVLALLGWLLVPCAPLHVQGWRWVMLIGGADSFAHYQACVLRFLSSDSFLWFRKLAASARQRAES